MPQSPTRTIAYTNAGTGRSLVVNHVDRGPQSLLTDGLGRACVGTTARCFAATPVFDALHRPLSATVVSPTGKAATVAQRTAHVDSTSSQFDPALNHCGRPIESCGQAGWGTPAGFSLHGAPAGASMAMARTFQSPAGGMPALDIAELAGTAVKPAVMGWQSANGRKTLAYPQNTTYTTTLAHDALGRPTQAVDGLDHTAQTSYRLSGWPEQLSVDGQDYLDDIQHNAKGQVLQLSQGHFDNGANSGSYMTCLRYTAKNYRMHQAYTTTSAGFVDNLPSSETAWIDGSNDPGRLQDARYTFDPAANVLETAGVWPDTVFRQSGVTAVNAYTLDARYRLLWANGLEGPANSPVSGTPMQGPAVNALDFDNGYAQLMPFERITSTTAATISRLSTTTATAARISTAR